MSQITCIVQARMGSKRLPGKVLKPINGIPMLQYQLTRLRQLNNVRVVVATSDTQTDDALAEYCAMNSHEVYRGDENNVLKRFYDLSNKLNLIPEDRIIRLTGDCPLVCADLIAQLVDAQVNQSNQYGRIDTDYFPRGVDAELFTYEMLISAFKNASSEYECEHVTPYFYQSGKYSIVKLNNSLGNHSHYRLCVDEPSDHQCVSAVISELGDAWADANYQDIISVLLDKPALAKLNQSVIQKITHMH